MTLARTSRRVLVLLGALTLCLAPPPGAADPDVAKAALEAGRNALARKEWTNAQVQFRRALEEDPDLHEAQVGLGEALVGAGERPRAAQAFRTALSTMELVPALSNAQLALYTKTRKRLNEVNKDDAALDLLVRKHAETLVGIGTRWASKDTLAAGDALRAALRLAPDHPKAADLLAKLGEVQAKKPIVLFNARDGSGWMGMSSEWTIESGVLVGNVPTTAMFINTQKTWSGDFDVLIEACLLEEFPKNGPPYFAVLAAWADQTHHSALGCLRGGLHWRDASGPNEADQRDHYDRPYSSLREGANPRSWFTYELRMRGNQMIALVDGKEVARAPRPPDRQGGHVALKVQCCKAGFRRVEITPR